MARNGSLAVTEAEPFPKGNKEHTEGQVETLHQKFDETVWEWKSTGWGGDHQLERTNGPRDSNPLPPIHGTSSENNREIPGVNKSWKFQTD